MAHRSLYLPNPNIKYQGFLGGNNNQNNNNNNNSQDGIWHKMTETERLIAQAGGTFHKTRGNNSRNNSSNNRYYQRSDLSFIPPRSSRTQSSGIMVPNSRVKKRKVKGSTRANNMQRRGQQTKLDVRRKSDREHKKRQKRNSEEKFRNNSNRHKFDQNGPLSQSMTGNYDGNSQRSSNSRKRRAENNNSKIRVAFGPMALRDA